MEIEQIIIAQNSDIEKQKQLEEDKQKALDQLKNISEKLASLENVNLENNRVNIENIFSVVNDHKVIMDAYKSLLPNIDISMMSFKNVDVSGIDFSNTNLNTTLFNPQEVYQRNISGCDFTGLYFSPFSFDLSNVDVRGTSFSSGPNDENTIPNFENALYDETTTYNGVPITEIIKQEEIEVEGPIYK